MFNHSGYLVPFGEPAPTEEPLTVLSSGHYRLLTWPSFHTFRAQGQFDYQLLYVAEGKAEFLVDGVHRTVNEGHIVVYRPYEVQDYFYRLSDAPRVYWIHFTGTDAAALLQRCGLDGGCFFVGVHTRYRELMESIIRELQLHRPLSEDVTAALFRELLVCMARYHHESTGKKTRSEMVEQAVCYLEQHFAEPIIIADLARQYHVEVCWFSRIFRRQMGLSPQQYLTQIRMTEAREMLTTTEYPVGEIARLVGYINPLYFSRLFGRLYECSPREYRKRKKQGEKP